MSIILVLSHSDVQVWCFFWCCQKILGVKRRVWTTIYSLVNDGMVSPAMASGVAHAALKWFESSLHCQKKIPASHWTVLSVIVVCTTSISSSLASQCSYKFRVLAAATGTKCLGRRDLNADGLVVNDCHAEVLARRAFIRYLYAETLFWQDKGPKSSQHSIFERHSTSHRLVLKPQNSIHLFITEAPCGDAAIYELRKEVVDELVQHREAREIGQSDERERTELRLTGAKVHNKKLKWDDLPKYRDTPLEKKFSQVVGIARVKSGRSDLPLEKQTLSMSCSDKIAKWNALGLQGSLLLQWFEPIFLSSVVVIEDDQAVSVEKQEQALYRAVCTRLVDRKALIEGASLSCETLVVSGLPQFSRRRTPDRAPSSLAINWTTRETYWTRIGKNDFFTKRWNLAPQSMEANNFTTRFFNEFEYEFLMAANGFKQGANKAIKMHRVAMEKVASRLAKKNMLRAFHYLLGQLSDCFVHLDYLQLKRLDELIALPDASSTALTGCKKRRKQFFIAFSDWIGIPATFKQFKV